MLILAGSEDPRASVADAEQFAERIGDGARVVAIEGADHGELLTTDMQTYRTVVEALLGRCEGLVGQGSP